MSSPGLNHQWRSALCGTSGLVPDAIGGINRGCTIIVIDQHWLLCNATRMRSMIPKLKNVDGTRLMCSACFRGIARYPDCKCCLHTSWLTGSATERWSQDADRKSCAQAWKKYHKQVERRLRTTALCDIFPGKLSVKGTTE